MLYLDLIHSEPLSSIELALRSTTEATLLDNPPEQEPEWQPGSEEGHGRAPEQERKDPGDGLGRVLQERFWRERDKLFNSIAAALAQSEKRPSKVLVWCNSIGEKDMLAY